MARPTVTRELIEGVLATSNWWENLGEFERDNSGTPEPEEIEARLEAAHQRCDFGDDEEAARALVTVICEDICREQAEEVRAAALRAADLERAELTAQAAQLARLVRASVPRLRVEHVSRGGSHYFRYQLGELLLNVRVADHAQVRGGGWCPESGERHGECDVQFVAGGNHTRATIRAAIVKAIRAAQ